MIERVVNSVLRNGLKPFSPIRRHSILFALVILSAAINCAIAKTGQNTWLVFVTLVPLFWSIRSGNAGLAGACGALWGGTIAFFAALGFGPPLAIAPVSVSLLIAAPAIYAAIGARLTRWIGFSPLVLAVAWTGMELLQLPLGGRSGLFSSAHEHSALLDVIARTFGYVLIAFAVAYLNAAMLSLVAIACGRVGNLSRKFLRAPSLPNIDIPSFQAVRSYIGQTIRSRAPPKISVS